MMRELERPEQAGTLEQILQLHRHVGTVLFTDPTKSSGFGIGRALTPEDMQLFDDIDRTHGSKSSSDMFMTINPVKPAGSKERNTVREHSTFRAGNQHVSHLTAVWVDIDCREVGLSVGDVVGAVETLIDSGALPRPSAEILSGRGVWYMWYLHDRETGTAPAATGEEIERVTSLNKHLVTLLGSLGADSQSVNVGRWMRVPNSCNTKAGKRVAFKVTTTDKGALSYEVSEIERLLSSPVTESIPSRLTKYLESRNLTSTRRPNGRVVLKRKTTRDQAERTRSGQKDPIKASNGKAGKIQRFKNLKIIIEFIAETRGGIPIGKRSNSVMYYATALRYLGRDLQSIRTATYSSLPFQESEDEPFTPEEIENAIRSAMSGKPAPHKTVRYNTLGKFYDLTEKERAQLYRRHMILLPLFGETAEDMAAAARKLTGREFKIGLLREILTSYGTNPDTRPADYQIKCLLNTRLQQEDEKGVSRSTFYSYKSEIEGTPSNPKTPCVEISLSL